MLFQNQSKEIDPSFLLKTQDRQDAVFEETFTNPIDTGIKPEKTRQLY